MSRDRFLAIIAIALLCPGAAIGQASSAPAAKVFAPGVISGPDTDMGPSFVPGGYSLYFSRRVDGDSSIQISYNRHGSWSLPVTAPFSGTWNDLEIVFAPSGKYLIFASNRPARGADGPLMTRYFGKDQSGGALWRMDVQDGKFGEATRLAVAVNRGSSTWTPSIAANDDLYFMRTDEMSGRFRLFRSSVRHGQYRQAKPLSFSTGTFNDVDPAVEARGSFLIFSSDRAAPGVAPNPGPERLFIAFRPNSAHPLVCPISIPGWKDPSESQIEARLSLNGQELFFSSRHPDHQEDQPPAGAWDNGKANIWMIPFNPSLWRDAPGADSACRTHGQVSQRG
jgi:hypothetical protein